MVIRRFGRELPPATEEGKAKFRALFSDDDWITFGAYFNDAKRAVSGGARTALSSSVKQYTIYLEDVVEEPVTDSMWEWSKTHRRQPRGTADDVRWVRSALAAARRCIVLLKGRAGHPTAAQEAIGTAVKAFFPLLAQSDRVLRRLPYCLSMPLMPPNSHATVTLRVHELTWKRDRQAPGSEAVWVCWPELLRKAEKRGSGIGS